MHAISLSKTPLLTNLNRVERLYTGGALLDRWQGISPASDGPLSEEYLMSTAEYMGPGNPPHNGISQVALPDGGTADLRALIAGDPVAFLGERYAARFQDQSGVLVRVGDAKVRLVIQCHPTTEAAKAKLGVPFGKTEAWYIADTRTVDGVEPYLYCGFQKGVTRSHWANLLEQQDVEGMMACMHRIAVKRGDFILVEAGMPHAMGSGCLFVEVHEPCDYTIRMEREYATRTLTDEEMHYGLGFEALLDFFTYDTYTREEIEKRCLLRPVQVSQAAGGRLYRAVGPEHTDAFSICKLELSGTFSLPPSDGHFVVVTTEQAATLHWDGQSLQVPQGRGVFVPAGVGELRIEGQGGVLLAYPAEG